MIARYAISFSFAALITFGLFFGMQWLIAALSLAQCSGLLLL